MANIANNQRMANLANAKITSDITSSATSVTVDDASIFPSPVFYATLMPGDEMSSEGNSEIVKVTAINSNTLTIVRGQRSTTARAFATGSVLTNGVYTEDLEYAQSVGRTAFDTSYLNGVYTITTNTDMLPSTPEDGMRITIKVNTDSAGTPGLDLKGTGSIYSIYTGVQFNEDYYNDPAILYSGKMYDLEFNNGSWYATNVAAQITADDMDDTYAGTFAYLSGNQVTPSSNVFVYTNNIDDGAVTLGKINTTTLFTSQAGQGLGTFVLSDAIENYAKLEIEYADNSGNRGLKAFRVVPGGTNQTTLTTFQPGTGGDNTFYIQSAIVTFSGANGNVIMCRGGAIFNGGYPAVDADPRPNILIYSVVGYN